MSPSLDAPTAPALPAAELQGLLATLLAAWAAQSGAWVSLKDLDSGRYAHLSPGLAALMGHDVPSVLGRTDAELLDAGWAAALRAAEHTAQAQGETLVSEHRLEREGARHDFRVLRMVARDASGRRWMAALWQDLQAEVRQLHQLRAALEQIEQQQQANERLRREMADQALRDPASGLHRRAHFEDQLRREVDLSMREHREFSVVFIDLDPPSPKVLALGAAGELRVLEAMGRLLRNGTRAMDAACRYDERRFAVLLSGVGLATAHARMEGLRRKCATQIVVHEGQELGFTVSMGVASFPHTAGTQDALMTACHAALAEAQRRGGNHVTLAAISFDAA